MEWCLKWFSLVFFLISLETVSALTTEDRIRKHGYPVERHVVQTSDSYILTMFRIPYPANYNGTSVRPIAFLQHGLLSSSDCWILNGPGIALAYELVEAGYDVWLGNARGNTYSKKHAYYSPIFHSFWNFEWHQIAVYDIPAMIDYALFVTNQKSVHYIGHSQGTTVFLVMTSIIPEYNDKIKSAQLLSPVAFIDNLRGPLVDLLGPVLGLPNVLVEILGSVGVFPSNVITDALRALACTGNPILEYSCSHVIFILLGVDVNNFNMTLFDDAIETHPAGASVNQILHYLQEHLSGRFRQFDYGFVRNFLTYGQLSPPEYDLARVTAPTFLYYSDNDYYAHPVDVRRLMANLPNVLYSFNVPDPKWNHLDFLLGNNVKHIIFDRVLENVNDMEKGQIIVMDNNYAKK